MANKLSVAIHHYDSGKDIDVTERIQSVTVDEQIDDVSTFSAEIMRLSDTHSFDDIAVTYGGETLFIGTIEGQDDSLRGGHRFSAWYGSDWALKMQNRLANQIYEEITIEAIIFDLLERYPCGITTNNVRPTHRVIETIDFPYVPIIECIQQLADIAGWRWYVDADRDLHFFDTDEGLDSSIVFSTVGNRWNILNDTLDLNTQINDRTANRVWIIGARQASQAFVDQYWTGDGLNDIFTISYTPNYPAVWEGGQRKTIELDKGMGTDKDYTYDKKNKVLRRAAGPLPKGVELKLEYRPTTQIIDYFQDSASIARYGIYEKAIKDKQIVEKMAARARGRSELRRRNHAIQTITFDTRELGVRRGMRYRVHIPELNLDREFVCIAVSTHIAAPDNVNITKTVTLEAVN